MGNVLGKSLLSQFRSENVNRKDNLEESGIYKKILLKGSLKKLDIIKLEFKEIWWETVDQIHLPEDGSWLIAGLKELNCFQ